NDQLFEECRAVLRDPVQKIGAKGAFKGLVGGLNLLFWCCLLRVGRARCGGGLSRIGYRTTLVSIKLSKLGLPHQHRNINTGRLLRQQLSTRLGNDKPSASGRR